MMSSTVTAATAIELRFAQPVVTMVMRAPPAPDELREAINRRVQETTHWPYVLTVVDMRHQTEGLSGEARKVLSRRPQTGPAVRGIAIFGASYAMRTTTTLLMDVLDLGGENEAPCRFFDTEAEAMTWIEDRQTTLNATLDAH